VFSVLRVRAASISEQNSEALNRECVCSYICRLRPTGDKIGVLSRHGSEFRESAVQRDRRRNDKKAS
jgi:hypothetical protein